MWKNSSTRCFLWLSFFFFISNIKLFAKIKDLTLQSLKWESSHFSSFSVNLWWYFQNYCQILSENYLQILSKIVIYHLVETHNHVHNILRLFDVWPNFSFLYIFLCTALFYMKTRVCVKYFVNDCSLRSIAQGPYKLRALFTSPLIHYVFLFTLKSSEKHQTDLWLGMSKDAMHTIWCTLLLISPASYTKLELLIIMRLLDANIA